MNGFLNNPVFTGFIIAVLFALFALMKSSAALWTLIAVVAFLAWLEITHHGDYLNGLARSIFDSITH